MRRWLGRRRLGLVLESISLATAGVLLAVVAQLLPPRGPSDDAHRYVLLFGSIFLVVLGAISLLGIAALAVWWRTGRDTGLILYDVLATTASNGPKPAAIAA